MGSSQSIQLDSASTDLAFVPKAVTDIDRRKCSRVVPMRVLVLGLSRTGTNSLRVALEHLGYNSTYHGYAAVFENPRDCEMWLQALDAKFNGKGKPFGRFEFDQLLGHCQAVSDAPAICFAPELIAAYPEAKVILTNRNIDSWYNAVMRTLIARVYNPQAAVLARLAWFLRSTGRWSRPVYTRVFDQYFRHFPTNGKQVFEEHYSTVRQLVPQENLLEWNVKEGWGPLCKFLDHEEPDMPFPRTNDDEATGLMISNLLQYEIRKAGWRCLYALGWMTGLYILVSVTLSFWARDMK